MSDQVGKHTLQIVEDIVVPIPDDCDISFREKTRAERVRLLPLRGVLTAINFDGEAKTRTVEIERERADRVLPSEVQAIELIAAKRTP
jgi:hypothetical protein